MTDLDELRKLAEAATPGPWRVYPGGRDGIEADGFSVVVYGDDNMDESDGVARHEDAAYIAAANPATVLWLLDLIQENSDDQ